MNIEEQYLSLLGNIITNGTDKSDRTGTGTRSLFGHQMRHDLSKGFPMLTTKRLPWKAIYHELLWFIAGDTNVKYLQDNGVKIWDEWADENGDLGPVYGEQWRNFGAYEVEDHNGNIDAYSGVDQLVQIVERIKTNPDCRRLIVSAWNPVDLPDMALAPCHCLFQFYVVNGKLSCQLYQRSADVFLGVPFNIASYALLTHMVAHVCGLEVGEFVHTFGDVHIYNNHFEQVDEQLTRRPMTLPTIKFNRQVTDILDFKFEDIELVDYTAHPTIKAEVSV